LGEVQNQTQRDPLAEIKRRLIKKSDTSQLEAKSRALTNKMVNSRELQKSYPQPKETSYPGISSLPNGSRLGVKNRDYRDTEVNRGFLHLPNGLHWDSYAQTRSKRTTANGIDTQ